MRLLTPSFWKSLLKVGSRTHKVKDSFCSYCSAEFKKDTPYPKHCSACGEYAWGNPLPVVIAVFPVVSNGKIGLLIQQRNIDPQKDKWALTGGYINHNEGWREAIARESMEELGLTISPNKFLLHDVVGGKNSALQVVCLYDGVLSSTELASFKPNNEVQAIDIMYEPRDLAFPSHTQAVNELLNSVVDFYKYSFGAPRRSLGTIVF